MGASPSGVDLWRGGSGDLLPITWDDVDGPGELS